MNFNRHSPCEDLLFVIVLLLPPVLAGARYAESYGELAHIFRIWSEAASGRAGIGGPKLVVPLAERRSR